ncbi:MAG TPA: hypothetical protein VGK52_10405 [Polyangia bacterium]|jgi:hypothetical protein
MRRAVLGAVGGACASLALGLGCTAAPPPAADSFTELYTTVIAQSCSSAFCHNNGVGIRYSGLDMSSRVVAYWNLVDQPLAGPSCALMGTRVVPFQPEVSLMYEKVKATPPCGSQMPANPTELLTKGSAVFSGTALNSDQVQLIHDWIAGGAQND